MSSAKDAFRVAQRARTKTRGAVRQPLSSLFETQCARPRSTPREEGRRSLSGTACPERSEGERESGDEDRPRVVKSSTKVPSEGSRCRAIPTLLRSRSVFGDKL